MDSGKDASGKRKLGDESERKRKRPRIQRRVREAEYEAMLFNAQTLMERHENLKRENEELKRLLFSAPVGDDIASGSGSIHLPIPPPQLPPLEVVDWSTLTKIHLS